MTVTEAMQAVENVMFAVVNSDIATLRDASRHILQAGGKRVRPRMLMLIYEALGGKHAAYAAPVAAAIELVHTASVVHDDINDHGVVRRGRPSVNAIWGRTFALLTGDFLFTKVYELMAPYKDLNIVLAEATVALVEGETLQAAAVKENNFTREIYLRIIALKTAALFKAAASLGAKLAGGASEDTVRVLGQYGYNVGLAFQIIDDVLDLTADTDQLGKTAGIDLPQGRGYAATYATNGVASPQVAVVETVDQGDPMKAIKEKILRGDAISEAQIQARALVKQAVSTIDVLPPSDAKDQLIDLAYFVVERDR